MNDPKYTHLPDYPPPKSNQLVTMSTYCYNFAVDKYGSTWTTYTPDLSPCGDFNATAKVLPCCAKGDTCLNNALCRAAKALKGTSGYYRSGCTNPDFPDPICRKQCSKKISRTLRDSVLLSQAIGTEELLTTYRDSFTRNRRPQLGRCIPAQDVGLGML